MKVKENTHTKPPAITSITAFPYRNTFWWNEDDFIKEFHFRILTLMTQSPLLGERPTPTSYVLWREFYMWKTFLTIQPPDPVPSFPHSTPQRFTPREVFVVYVHAHRLSRGQESDLQLTTEWSSVHWLCRWTCPTGLTIRIKTLVYEFRGRKR